MKLHNLLLDLRAKLYDCHLIMQNIDKELDKLEKKVKEKEDEDDEHKKTIEC